MPSIRTLFAVLALVGLTFGTARAQLCDDRYPHTCPPERPTAAAEASESPKAAQTKRSLRTSSKRTVTKRSSRRLRSPLARDAAAKPPAEEPTSANGKNEKADAPPPETTAANPVEAAPTLPEKSPSPHRAVPIASQDEVNEIDLSADRLLVSPAPMAPPNTRLIPTPAAAANSAEQPTPSGPGISPRPAISVQTTTIVRPPDAADQGVRPAVVRPSAANVPAASPPPANSLSAVATAGRVSVASSSRSNSDSEDMSWLRRIFLGLGGVLALASAIRMFIG